MAIQKGIDAATGQEITWDDEATLIDGHPDLNPPSPEAESPASEPPQFWRAPEGKKDWKTDKGTESHRSGYSSPVDSPEFNELWRKHNPQQEKV